MTVAEIRAKYPIPHDANSPVGRYCTLGAALRYRFFTGDDYPLPSRAARLLSIKESDAVDIAKAHDRGDFERAWQLLDEALKQAEGQSREKEAE